MAIFAIPNPTKTIRVNYSLNKTRNAIQNIERLNTKYTKENFNESINNYKFSAAETLNIGCFVDIHLSEISNDKTEITITISRKIGTFDRSYEVTKANDHLTNIIDIISLAIDKTEEEINEIILESNKKAQKQLKSNRNNAKWFYGVFIILASLFYIYINYIHKK